MTYSIYEEIVQLEKKEATSKEVRSKLIELDIYSMFSVVYEKYRDAGTFNKVVFFIAHAYSYESPKIIIGQDWSKCKINIAKSVKLPEEYYNDLLMLRDSDAAYCMSCFLNLYKNNVDFVHVQKLKDMYQRIMEMGTKFKFDEDGDCELKENFTNIKNAEELLEKIDKYEKKMKLKYRSLTSNEEELSSVLPSNFKVESLRVEHSTFIKK